MSKQFIKTQTGKAPVGKPLTPIYPSVAAAQEAIENGELEEGQLFATQFVGDGGDLAADIQWLGDRVKEVEDKVDDLDIPDISGLETKTDSAAKLTEAKSYTDTKIAAIDLTPYQTKAAAATEHAAIEAKIPTFTLDTTTSTLTITLGA